MGGGEIYISPLKAILFVKDIGGDECRVVKCVYYFCTGGRAYSNAHFGAGSGPIFLDDVQCTTSSSQLLECPSRPILSHNCLHSADAGVGCEGMNIFIIGII